jgi:hypothetical protein
MIRVLLSAPLCLHIRLSSRFTCWPEIWIVPGPTYVRRASMLKLTDPNMRFEHSKRSSLIGQFEYHGP